MSAKVGIGLALDGEEKFKRGLKDVNLEMKLLDIQTKKVSIEYADNANSVKALAAKHDILTKKISEQQKKTALNREQLENWQKTSKNAAEKTEELRSRLEDAQKEMERMKNASGTTKEELEKQQQKIDGLNRSLKASEDAYEKSEGKVAKYRVSTENAETGLLKLDAELKKNEKYLDEAEKSSDGLAKSIDQYGKEVSQAKEKTQVFGDVLRANLLSDAIVSGVEKLAQGIAKITDSAVQTGAGFEASMSQVAATMGLTATEIAQGSEAYGTLAAAAEESGKTTKYSASQAAEALNYLALAGYDANKAAETLPYVLDLAAAGGLELAYASDLVTDSMAALGMESGQLENYINQLTRTAQKSNTSVAQLGEGSLVAAGMVSLTSQSIETMNAELGILANRGIKAAEGGTHLRNILQRLVQPTKEGAKALKEMGVEVTDSAGNVRDLDHIISDLDKSLSSMSGSDKANIIGTIFKVTDITAVNALLEGTGEEFDNLKNELLNCDNAAANMAETMNANLTGKVTILQSALEGLGITAYKKIEGTLKDSVDSATGAVGRLQTSMDNGKLGKAMDNFSDSLGDAAEGAISFAEDALPVVIDGLTWVLDNSDLVIAGIAGITAANVQMKVVAPAIETATAAWRTYKTANEGATVSQWLLNTAMNANPVGIIITAVVGLTAAVATYAIVTKSASKEVKEFQKENDKFIESQRSVVEETKKQNDSLELQGGLIDKLSNELTELNSKEKITSEEKTKIKQIVDQLNQVMPELNLTINEQTGYLTKSTDAMKKYITKSKDMLLMAAAEDAMTKAAQNLYDAETELAKKTAELEENQEKLKTTTEKCNEAYDNLKWYESPSGSDRFVVEVMTLTEEQEILTESIEQQKQVIADLEKEYAVAEDNAIRYGKSVAEANKYLEEAGEVQVTYKGKVYEVSEAVAENMAAVEAAYADAKQSAIDSINSQVGLFEELSTKSDLSVKQMAENLKTQSEAYNNYSHNLQLASQIMKRDTTGNFSEIVAAISEMGIAGAGYLDELVNAYYTNTEEFNRVTSEWGAAETAKEKLADTTASMETDYANTMDNLAKTQVTKGTQIGNESNKIAATWKNNYQAAGGQMVNDADSAWVTMEDITKRKGGKVADETGHIAKESKQAIEKEWEITGNSSKKAEDLGAAVALGMAAGIKNNQGEAIGAAAGMAAGAYNAAKSELQVNSPSRKFAWLADMCTVGFKERFTIGMQDAMASFDEIMHPEATGSITVKTETNPEILHLTKLLEEYLPECAKAKTAIPVNQLSKDMTSLIDKDLSISAARKERYN